MIHIAGGIVWNPDHGIVVVNQNNNSWSLPKGHVELGEETFAAAIREIHEETGIPSSRLKFIREVGSYERTQNLLYETDQPELRTITLYLFTTDMDTLLPIDPENPEAQFVQVHQVSALLTHQKDKEYFETFWRSAPEFIETQSL